jgi:tetratricopeptide (TPR) repeat protein
MQENRFQKLLEQGLDYSKAGLIDEATTCLEAARQILPNLPAEAWSALGEQYLKLGNFEAANTVFETAKVAFPASPVGYVGVARVSIKQAKWQQAADQWGVVFNKFQEETQPFWYAQQAKAWVQLGRHEKARENYVHCINTYPKMIYGYVGMAQLAGQNEEWEEALKYWDICLDRFPAQENNNWFYGIKRAFLGLKRIPELQEAELSRFESSSMQQVYLERIRKKMVREKPQPLNFSHVLIITYGRSGSTLLQGILNTIDGLVMRGENGNVFYDLFKAYRNFRVQQEKHWLSTLPNQSWYGIGFSDDQRLILQYRELAKAILATDRYDNADQLSFGFKEIRYSQGHIEDDFYPYLKFLKQLFPNPAFIFLSRNLEDVSKSAWWKDVEQETVIKMLRRLEQKFNDYSQKNNHCYQITYQDIVTASRGLKGLFEFLGAPFEPEIIESALNFPHSYSPAQKHVQHLFERRKPLDNSLKSRQTSKDLSLKK